MDTLSFSDLPTQCWELKRRQTAVFFTFYDTLDLFPVQFNLNSRIIFYLLLPNFKALTTAATKWIKDTAFFMPGEEARDRMEWRLAGRTDRNISECKLWRNLKIFCSLIQNVQRWGIISMTSKAMWVVWYSPPWMIKLGKTMMIILSESLSNTFISSPTLNCNRPHNRNPPTTVFVWSLISRDGRPLEMMAVSKAKCLS